MIGNVLIYGSECFNPLTVVSLLLSNWHGDNFVHTLTWHGVYFFIFTVWHGLFSLVLKFPGLRIEALPLSTVQGTCLYKIFKAENKETQFPVFIFPKYVNPEAELLAICATLLVRPIYWLSVAQ